MKKLIFLFLCLTGCGFTPLYSTKSPTYQILQNTQIEITPIPNEYGANMYRILKNQIPTLTTTPKNKYILTVHSPEFSGYDKTITNDEFASTIQASAAVFYTLTDNSTHKVLQQNTLSAISSYAVNNNPYATTVAQKKVYQELSEQLAQQVGLNVMAFISKDSQ